MKTAYMPTRIKKKELKIKSKKIKIAITLTLLLASCFLLLASTRSVLGQELRRTITIVPPSAEITLDPGGKTQGTLKVINDSDNALTFTASTQDFTVDDTKGTPNLLPKNTLSKKFSGASWVGIVPDTFTVAPHDKAILQYFIQVPSNARPGGHYAAIVYTPTTVLGGKNTGPAVQTEIGTLLSIDVNGQITENAKIASFFANPFQEYGPVNIYTEIRNFGDLHIKPLGVIKITDMTGHEIVELPLDQHNIFPEAARDFTNAFGSTWMMGRYKATLQATYGKNNNLPLIASVYFIVFPWKVATVVLLAIIAAVLAFLLYKKRGQKPQEPQDNMTKPVENPNPTMQ